MNTTQRILLAARLWLHQHGLDPAVSHGATAAHKDYLQKMNDELDQGIAQHEDAMRTQYNDQSSYPSIGKDNQILMDALSKAKKVAIDLARAGHRVLDISIGSRNARLTISASNRCHLLGGAMIKLARLNGIEEKTMATNIDGVQVEWTTSIKMEKGFNGVR